MKYAVISAKGSHDYDIELIETEQSKSYSIYYSNAEIWNFPGEHLITITDDGNDMYFNPKLKKKLDFAKFVELSILIDFIRKHDSQLMEEYTIYKPI